MLTRTSSRLFRRLLSLVICLRLSVGRIALALRAQFALLWRSILGRRDQPQIRLLHASDVPAVNNNLTGEPLQTAEREKVEEEDYGAPAALPVWRATRWRDELSKYQTLTSSYQFKFEQVPATPEKASQRYRTRTVRWGFSRCVQCISHSGQSEHQIS